MTKPKHGSFVGAWMDGRIPEALIVSRLTNEAGVKISTAPVVAVLRRQMELWRFDLARRDVEPQPAQWAVRVREIVVPDPLTTIGTLELRQKIDALPLATLAVMDAVLLQAHGIGRIELLRRMLEIPTQEDADMLRSVLAELAEGLRHIAGKRGPRADSGPALRAVVAALLAHSNMKPVPARNLAADLLRMVGINAPESRGRLAEMMRE